MKLIFFDESKNDPEHPHYHIGAVCINESDLVDVEKRIGAIAVKAFGTAQLTRETELHATDIFQRKNNFKPFPDFGKRLELLCDFADILSLPQVQRIDIQISCQRLYAQTPEDLAFMFLVEKANELLVASRSLGMLIGDRENDQIAARFATTLSGYRARGTDFAFGRDITNLVDCVHFTHWYLQFDKRHRGSTHERHRAVLGTAFGRAEVNVFPSKYKVWPPV